VAVLERTLPKYDSECRIDDDYAGAAKTDAAREIA
jgi:hypothetical protein